MKWRSLEESNTGTETRSLREIFAERRQRIAQYVPADIQAVHARVIAELTQSRIADRALQVGAKAPEFEVKDHNGIVLRSADLLRSGPLVLCFIRGRWDPFCCGQMEAMNRVLPEIQEHGATLAAISPQTVHQSFFMVDQHKLRFPLLSDAGNQVAKKFGLAYRVPEDQQEIYRRVFINLPFIDEDDSWELPIPATYVMAQDGVVIEKWANPDYSERPEPEEIVEALSSVAK